MTAEPLIGGQQAAERCRKHGISEARYDNGKAQFGGMTVSDAQRLKALEQENNTLKQRWQRSSDATEGVDGLRVRRSGLWPQVPVLEPRR